MDIALKIRRDAEERKDSFSELLLWEKEAQQKDRLARKSATTTAAAANRTVGADSRAPVRSQGQISTSTSAPSASRASAGAVIKSWDYKSWDKFDVDKALEEVDYQPASTQPQPQDAFVNDSPVLEDDVNVIEEALIEKEKGNAYFKRKDYKKAVACYTKSIKLNAADVTPVVNRAMAYLKLERWAEAEADCTLGLAMQPKNVKALWRRGIAQKQLGKLGPAGNDLEMAAVLEPTNAAIKEELNALRALQKQQASKSSSAKPVAGPAPVQPPRRRRLVINEVGEPAQTPVVSAETIPVPPLATEPLHALQGKTQGAPVNMMQASPAAEPLIKPAALSAGSQAHAATPATTAQLTAASATENATPTVAVSSAPTVSAQSTTKPAAATKSVTAVVDKAPAVPSSVLAESRENATRSPASSVSSPSRKKTLLLGVPKTMYEFERDWKSIRTDSFALYEYLKAIAPSELQMIFRSSLESHYVSKILEILRDYYVVCVILASMRAFLLDGWPENLRVAYPRHETAGRIYETLAALSRVERFGMIARFMSRQDKEGGWM
ncbi:hypothetical protein BC831DRAFT_441589 [Entophlyctis helioformis]|nr:hypothetical protein BC831DRAFT_441589 [Entophlyctis helioformis]